jgi:hypothetical protein
LHIENGDITLFAVCMKRGFIQTLEAFGRLHDTPFFANGSIPGIEGVRWRAFVFLLRVVWCIRTSFQF